MCARFACGLRLADNQHFRCHGQQLSKTIQNHIKFMKKVLRVFLSLENLALQHPTGNPPSFLSLLQWLQQESYTSDCCTLFIRTHHPLGCSLSLPCLCSPVSASKLSKTRRSSACSSCQFDPICQFVSWLQRYACRLYSSIFATATSSEPYIICMTLTI